MKWRIDDVPVFVAVVDQNGITPAARMLGMPKSTVSTAITRLEQGLGLRLIERSSRALRVTPDGEAFYRQAQLIMDQVREADATAAGLSAEPMGRLTAALPPAFTQEIFAPRLGEFRARHPGVELELVVTGHGAEMLRDTVDVAVVVGPQADSELVSRVLIGGPLVWIASPDYLAHHRIGPNLDDLRRHIQLCETRYGLARMPVHIGGQSTHIDLARGIVHVNDPLAVRRAVMHGAGVSLIPHRYSRDQIADGSLVEVAPHITFDAAAAKLSVLYPHRRLVSPRLRVFIDFLSEICA